MRSQMGTCSINDSSLSENAADFPKDFNRYIAALDEGVIIHLSSSLKIDRLGCAGWQLHDRFLRDLLIYIRSPEGQS